MQHFTVLLFVFPWKLVLLSRSFSKERIMKLFFALCVVYIVRPLPYQSRFSRKFSRYVRELLHCNSCERMIVAWHKSEVEKFDPEFCFQQAGLRLAAAQDKAEQEGLSPSDPKYPKDLDFHPLSEPFGDEILRNK